MLIALSSLQLSGCTIVISGGLWMYNSVIQVAALDPIGL